MTIVVWDADSLDLAIRTPEGGLRHPAPYYHSVAPGQLPVFCTTTSNTPVRILPPRLTCTHIR